MYRLPQRIAEKAAERISRIHGSKVVEVMGIRTEQAEIGGEWTRWGGARIVYRTEDIQSAKRLRDLHQASGFKYSRIVPEREGYLVICETTENITLPQRVWHDKPGIRIIKILLFLRTVKRLKMLLRNTKF